MKTNYVGFSDGAESMAYLDQERWVSVYSMYLGYITLHYPKKGGEEQKEMKLQLHAVKQGYIFEIEVNFPYCTEPDLYAV